jgi:hypothetical protein
MKDEQIYYINQYSFRSRPKIWSKRDFWWFQIVTAVIGVPVLVWVVFNIQLPLTSSFIIIMASSLGAAFNFQQGRKRAERYKIELATMGQTPYYGKYTLDEMRSYGWR